MKRLFSRPSRRSSWKLSLLLLLLLALGGCSGCQKDVDTALGNLVVFEYDHVANVKQVRFSNSIPGVTVAGNYVEPVDQGGFWAVFLICSLDVQGSAIQTFNYDARNFFVEHGTAAYGPLQPHKVRYGASTVLNSPADTPKIIEAVARETQLGPTQKAFPRQLFPSLNYRVAVFIPEHPQGYQGGQLDLKYSGQPSYVNGGGNSPQVIPFVGPQGTPLAGTCRAP